MEQTGSNVIRIVERSCFDCVNHSYGPRGLYCHEFAEFLTSDVLAAEDCAAYEA